MNHDINSALEFLKDYFSKYDNFVRLNPRIAAEIEAIIRWSSYLIATKKSPILGELLSSGANILQLCNDIILRQSNPQLKLNLKSCATQLKTFLSVIQSLELLTEIYARETYGNTGKWVMITVIQIAKAAIKLILLLVYNDGLTKSQAIVPLDRIQYTEIVKLQEKFSNSKDVTTVTDIPEEQEAPSTSRSLVLKSTGRTVRSITGSPPRDSRFSKSESSKDINGSFNRLQKQRLTMLLDRYKEHKSAALTEKQLYGEVLHVTQPLAHLALMGSFGTMSWIPYFTSIIMDISSLYLVRSPSPISFPLELSPATNQQTIPKCFQFNMSERMELGQRVSSLVLYILRSPFFDEYTKQRALEGLATTAENIPLLGHFLATFINYIPDWQKDYFRVWNK